jgi:hypothetical protein
LCQDEEEAHTGRRREPNAAADKTNIVEGRMCEIGILEEYILSTFLLYFKLAFPMYCD